MISLDIDEKGVVTIRDGKDVRMFETKEIGVVVLDNSDIISVNDDTVVWEKDGETFQEFLRFIGDASSSGDSVDNLFVAVAYGGGMSTPTVVSVSDTIAEIVSQHGKLQTDETELCNYFRGSIVVKDQGLPDLLNFPESCFTTTKLYVFEIYGKHFDFLKLINDTNYMWNA